MSKSGDPDATVRWLVDEFRAFLSERESQRDIHKRRAEIAAAFLKHPHVAECSWTLRTRFLAQRGFSTHEIEDAMEAVDERAFLAYVEGRLEDDADGPPFNGHHHNGHGGGSGVGPAGGAGPSAGGGGADDATAVMRISDEEVAPKALWKIGAVVYAYDFAGRYFPVPLVCIDLSRAEDVLGIKQQLPTGEYGPLQFLTPGFKGVVPDEFAPHHLLPLGATVLFEVPGGYRGHCKEAVVVAKSAQQGRDGFYTVDLERCDDQQVIRGVDHRSVRMLVHPRRAQWESERHADAKARLQLNTDRVSSAAIFPFASLDPEFAADPQVPEHWCRTSFLKNFSKYPDLDIAEPPRNFRNAASFVSQFGDTDPVKGKVFPRQPPSQSEQRGIGYEFNLSMLPRHPIGKAYYLTNPIVEVAKQCVRKDQLFVDPDFPPSTASLIGLNAQGTPTNITWRRASEILHKPRIRTVGTKAMDIASGFFAPSWFINVLHALESVPEAEDMISPAEDGHLFGAYVVRLFVDGQWSFVLIDDFIPCAEDTGAPLTLVSATPTEIYPMLIEKAIAKISGGYFALKRPTPTLSMGKLWEDLTGNITEVAHHHPNTVTKDSHHCNNAAWINTGTNTRSYARCRAGTRYRDLGIFPGAYWYIDHVATHLPLGSKQALYFYHVVRPTNISEPVFTVARVRERLLSLFPPAAVEQLPDLDARSPPNVVSYWLTGEDYLSAFDRTTTLWFHSNTQRTCVTGTWRGYPGAGGRMDGTGPWLANPQLLASFVQPAEVIIELKLLDRRLREGQRIDGRRLQLHILKGLPVERRLTTETECLAASSTIDLEEDEDTRGCPSATIRASLPGGNVVFVPSVGGESSESFALKIISAAAFYARMLPHEHI